MLVICFILAQNRENFNSSGPYIPIQFQAVFYAGIVPAANTLPPFNTILSTSAKPCGADDLRACLYIYRRRRSSSSRRRRFHSRGAGDSILAAQAIPFSRRRRFHSRAADAFHSRGASAFILTVQALLSSLCRRFHSHCAGDFILTVQALSFSLCRRF